MSIGYDSSTCRKLSRNLGLLLALFVSQRAIADPIRWAVLDGGNGHFYELVPEPLTWAAAKAAAEARTFNGMPGHLVTITSEAENLFVIENVFDPQNPGWIGLTDNEMFGGFESIGQPNPKTDGWVWVTGEPVVYTYWWHDAPNDLNGEDFALMGGSEGTPWWNDGQTHWTPYYIVEFGDSIIRNVKLFYNNSAFDANGAAVDTDDFVAIAPDKDSLQFGGAAQFTNVSGYSRGINGIFVDIADLPSDGAGIDAQDFAFTVGNDDLVNTWMAAPAPTSVGVLPGQGEHASDRVYVTFADGAVADMWLRVTVKANEDTNLAADQDFFFASAPGETGAAFVPGVVAADAADLQSIAQSRTPLSEYGTELITEPHDVNRDRSIDAYDLQVVARRLSSSAIDLITPQFDGALSGQGIPEPTTESLIAFISVFVIATYFYRWRTISDSSRLFAGTSLKPRT